MAGVDPSVAELVVSAVDSVDEPAFLPVPFIDPGDHSAVPAPVYYCNFLLGSLTV